MDGKLNLTKLNELYDKASSVDEKLFAEMRSNVLLNSGEHYKRISRNLDSRLRSAGASKDTRIRLTKNHIKVINSDIQDLLLNQVSDYKPVPKNETDLQDQKAAELAESVWIEGKKKNRWQDFVHRSTHGFVVTGEAFCKIAFDPNMGKLKGYEQKLTDDGEPLFVYGEDYTTSPVDEMGQPLESVADKKRPKFFGKVNIQKLDPFNVLRAPEAKTIEESPYLIVRSMVSVEKLKEMFANTEDHKYNEEIREKISESSDRTYKVFDISKEGFVETSGEAMVREFYFRQCYKYPRGYMVMALDNHILYEDELPYGEEGEIAFPIKGTGYDIIDGCPRYSAPSRDMRPIQAEVNRAASAIAETQVTLGMDKLIIQGGGKLDKGAALPGIRVFNVQGPPPTVVPGRSGEQFTGYLKDNIQEMYGMFKFDFNLSKASQSEDPKANLYKSAKQQAKYFRQQERLEGFFRSIVDTYLFLESKYLDEEEVIRAVGKSEAINISEFKNKEDGDYSIDVVPVSGDHYTMASKVHAIEIIGQYFGKDLPQATQAAIVRTMPFLNKEPAMKEMMLEYEAPTNMLLALDRGEEFTPSKYDNSQEMLRRLYQRVREASFKLLSPEIQESYASVISEYEEIQARQEEEAIRLKNGMIPSGGSLTKCDIYVNVPNSKGGFKTERAVVPSQAIEWLISALEKQGMSQDRLTEIGPAQAQIDVMNNVLPQEPLIQEDMRSGFNQPELPVLPRV